MTAWAALSGIEYHRNPPAPTGLLWGNLGLTRDTPGPAAANTPPPDSHRLAPSSLQITSPTLIFVSATVEVRLGGRTFFLELPVITNIIIPESGRMAFVDKLFGLHFPMRLEPTIYDMAGRLASEYRGGYWLFHSLSNGGVYMAPRGDTIFAVSCENGFEGNLSADALGIAACLYAYSPLHSGKMP